jgi:predicted RNA-binding Zn-ribbon protein involved in translation (DUF1610 family)
MEKYGVAMDDEKTKTAGSKKVCPSCGTTLAQNNPLDPPYCPNCGTKPFEKQPK